MRGFSLLLAAVLAAIGIGVGAEVAAQPTLYGPPGAQLRAAFPARPTVTTTSSGRIGRLVSYEARGPSGRLTVTVWTLRGSGWTGYSPVATLGSVQAFALTRGAVRPPQVHLTMRPATVAGEQVTLGVSCPTRTSCIAALFGLDRLVSGQLVQWSAAASGPSAAHVRALVTSLTPVSGTLLPQPHRVGAGA